MVNIEVKPEDTDNIKSATLDLHIYNSHNYDFIISLQREIIRKTFKLISLEETYAVIPKHLLDSRNINIIIEEDNRNNIRNIIKVLASNINLYKMAND